MQILTIQILEKFASFITEESEENRTINRWFGFYLNSKFTHNAEINKKKPDHFQSPLIVSAKSCIPKGFTSYLCIKKQTWWVNLRSGLPNTRAKPKSASFSCPLDPINKLFGFISLKIHNKTSELRTKSKQCLCNDQISNIIYLCNTHFLWQIARPFNVIWR